MNPGRLLDSGRGQKVNVNSSTDLYADKLDDYAPQYQRKSTGQEIALLELACGDRKCTNSIADKALNYYLIAISGVLLFIIFSIDSVDKIIACFVKSKVQRLIFKAAIIFIILYVLDRWLEDWRRQTPICKSGCIS